MRCSQPRTARVCAMGEWIGLPFVFHAGTVRPAPVSLFIAVAAPIGQSSPRSEILLPEEVRQGAGRDTRPDQGNCGARNSERSVAIL